MLKQGKKWIALLLTLALLLGCYPVAVFSVGSQEELFSEENTENTELSSEFEGQTVSQSVSTVHDDVIGAIVELEELREERVKHFRLPDGTYKAVTYSTPIHRKDPNGKWQEMDNTLALDEKNTALRYATPEGRVRFAEKYSPTAPLLSLQENGYGISLSLLQSPEGPGKLETESFSSLAPTVLNTERRQETVFSTWEEALRQEHSSKIRYQNVQGGTDLEYILKGNDIKENIIIKQAKTSYEYTFRLSLSGLTADLETSGRISLSDAQTGEGKYELPAPYMFDASGATSYGVAYALVEIKDGEYLLSVAADASWINAPERVFPVTVDPTIKPDEGVWASYTDSANPNENYCYEDFMQISNTKTAYIHPVECNMPNDAILTSVNLWIYYHFNVASGNMLVGAYPILEDWSDEELTYNNAPTVGTTQLSSATLTAGTYTEALPGLASFSVTSHAQLWYNSQTENYGFMLKWISGTTAAAQVHSWSMPDTYPYIEFTYINAVPDGVYSLRSNASLYHYMTVEGDPASVGNNLQQKYYASTPSYSSVFDRASLFKITKASATEERYIIRWMMDNTISFTLSGSEIITKRIPTNDADVAAADTFYIEWDGYGFKIRPYGSNLVISMTSTTTADLSAVAPSYNSSNEKWALHRYTGNHQSGGLLFHPSAWSSIGIVVGSTSSATAHVWSTYPNVNVPLLELHADYADVCEFVWNASQRSATLTATEIGEVRFNMYVQGVTEEEPEYLGYFLFMIVPEEGAYYIQNISTRKYVEVREASNVSGALIQQGTFHTETHEKWEVEHIANSGGYVRLKSVCSNFYLGIDPTDTDSVKQYSTQNDYTLWKIKRNNTSDNLILVCKATEASNLCLVAPAETAGSAELTQIAYTDDTDDRDEWKIYLLKYTAAIENFYDLGYCVRYNETEAESIQKITAYSLEVSERFMQLLGLSVEISSTLYYESDIDSCKGTVSSANINDVCEDCNPSHIIRNSVVQSFWSDHPGSTTTSTVFWTGHLLLLKVEDYKPDEYVNTGNRSCTYGNSVYVLDYVDFYNEPIGDDISEATLQIYEDTRRRDNIAALMHEMCHQYGARDHYHESGADGNCLHGDICSYCGENKRPESCNMNNSHQLIGGDDIICDECKEEIYAHLENHHRS